MTNRSVYIDNLRILLTLLVIVHHTAIAYGAAGSWYFQDPSADDAAAALVLTLLAAVNQAFFMALFFFLSALFTPGSYDRKGPSTFLKDRLLRLGLPFVTYFLLLNPLLVFFIRSYRGHFEGSALQFFRTNWWSTTGTGPLWFVLALIILAGVYAGFRYLAPGIAPRPIPLPAHRQVLAFCAAAGLVAFGVRLVFPTGREVLGLQFGYFTLYLCLFALGIVAFRNGWLDSITASYANRWFVIALAVIPLLPVSLLAGGALEGNLDTFAGGLHWQAMAYALWEPFVCVGMSLKLLQTFRDRFNHAGTIARAATRSAYTAYISHPFFVVGVTMALIPWTAPPWAKFLPATLIAAVACFGVSDLVRRLPGLRRIL